MADERSGFRRRRRPDGSSAGRVRVPGTRAAAAGIFLALAACGGGEEATPADVVTQDVAMVELTLRAFFEGDSLVVKGTANVPEGAVIRYTVEHRGLDAAPGTWTREGHAVAHGSQYRGAVHLGDVPAGQLLVRVMLQTVTTPPQPPEVIERYGPRGERMSGSDLEDAEGLRRVTREQQVEWRGTD